MKFDLHNLPFLAGGADYSLPPAQGNASGLCPGLYFVKELPNEPSTTVYDTSTQGYNPQAPGPVKNPNPEAKKYDNKNFIEWIVSQPNPCKYIEPCCIPVSQQKRYPNEDCCDGTEVVNYSTPVTGSVLLENFLNKTFRCLNICEGNFNPDRWSQNQYQLYCASSPNQFVKSWLNTIFEEPCGDIVTQNVQGNITHGVAVQNPSYTASDGVTDTRIYKSPDHWNYIYQNPKETCLGFRTWVVTERERQNALRKYGNWTPPCLKCLSPVGTNVRNCSFCQTPAFTHWLGRDIRNYNISGPGRLLFKPLFWENPALLGYYGPILEPGIGYRYDEEDQHFACLNPEQTRHIAYDDFPDIMRCYVDSVNDTRLRAFGFTADDIAFGTSETPVLVNGQYVYVENVPAMVFRGQNTFGSKLANTSYVWQGLEKKYWGTWAAGFGSPPTSTRLGINYSLTDGYEWGYSEMCSRYGFFGMNHLFAPGICGGGDYDGGANGLGRAGLGSYAVADSLRVHNAFPLDAPDKKYTCRYHPSWGEYLINRAARDYGLGTDSQMSDSHGKVNRFCSFGPDITVESDSSYIFGNWMDKCKAEWEKADVFKELWGCEDEKGHRRSLGFDFRWWECVANVLEPFPLGRMKPTQDINTMYPVNLCGPCNGWLEGTATYTKAKGLYFIPMPPTGIHYQNGCPHFTEDFDNYRLRYETKIMEVFPMPFFPNNTDTIECDDPTFVGDFFSIKNWGLKDVESRTEVKMIYSGDLSDIISDHGTGVFLTGMKITDAENYNARVGLNWNCEMPDFYELRDNCNILDSIPQGSDFYQITNSPCIEATNNGKTTVLHRGKTRLGPFIADSKIVVDYYKGNNYVAQSNWMSVKDEFMVIMPPPVKKSLTPHRVQSFHGMGHVFTHASSKRKNSILPITKQPYWFMKYMDDYPCVYDDLYNGGRVSDLYYQYNGIQFEFNYGLCNILTGPSS